MTYKAVQIIIFCALPIFFKNLKNEGILDQIF